MLCHGIANQIQKLVSRVRDGGERRVNIERAYRKRIIFGEHPSVIFVSSSVKNSNQLMLNG